MIASILDIASALFVSATILVTEVDDCTLRSPLSLSSRNVASSGEDIWLLMALLQLRTAAGGVGRGAIVHEHRNLMGQCKLQVLNASFS